MTAPSVTTYAETAALYHVLNEDYAQARRIAEEMLPNERAEFAAQLNRLLGMLGDPCLNCKRLTPAAQMVMLHPFDPERRVELCKSCAAAAA